MPRRFFRRYLPHPHKVREHRILRPLGAALHAPNLWHLNRASVSRGVALGLFWAMIPMPFQMLPAAICALAIRANVGLSIALVWLTNPLTMGPIYYATYRLGRILLGTGPSNLSFEFTYSSIAAHLGEIWQPLYAGSIVLGLLCGLSGYLLVQWVWRWNLGRRWRFRAKSRASVPA